MTLHQLKVFIKVAELKSFTRAAKELHLTQPSISALVQALTYELKYKFFERRGVSIALTPAGAVLLRRAREALAVTDAIKTELDAIHGLKKGTIKVGGSATAAALFLTESAQRFKEKYPGIEVALRIQSSDNVEKELLEGELDLALMRRAPRSPLVHAEAHSEEEILVIAPPNHPLARKTSLSLERLVKTPMIIHQRGGHLREMIERKFSDAGLAFAPMLEIDALFGGRQAIKSAVANGLGIGFLSRAHVIPELAAGKLKALNVPQLRLKRDTYIAVHKNRAESPLVQAFIGFLKIDKK